MIEYVEYLKVEQTRIDLVSFCQRNLNFVGLGNWPQVASYRKQVNSAGILSSHTYV
jgi:hypothetical protein